MNKEINIRVQKGINSGKSSKLKKYCELIVGSDSLMDLVKFELIIILCSMAPGALGLFLRSKLYKYIFKKCGRNTVFGSHITIRHPNKIEIGDNVIIDDNVMLDAKGSDNQGIKIDNGGFIGRNSILSCKNGDIILGENANIGFNSYIFSGSKVSFGKNALVAAYCYFIGGGHGIENVEKNFYDQACTSQGIEIGDNCWFGAGVKVQDGVKIGSNSLIGTSALVTKDIPEYSVAYGIPAKVVSDRRTKV